MVARVEDFPFKAGVIPSPYMPDPVLLAVVEIIRDGLLRDHHVRLHQFGTFRLQWTKPRRFKHPQTGEYMLSKPAPKVTFTPAKYLKDLIEPEPKALIPLDEAVDIATADACLDKVVEAPEDKPGRENQVTGDEDKIDLQHMMQDIIDERVLQHETAATGRPSKANKKWLLGLLAAVPVILLTLQHEFTSSPEQEMAAAGSLPVNPESRTVEINPSVIKPAVSPIRRQNKTNELMVETAAATARPEPTPRKFYMSPQLHEVQKGDSLWNLAKQFYGDARLWPHIYRANLRTMKNPDLIYPGGQLVIPGLQQAPDNLSGRDRELVAEGYFKVYQYYFDVDHVQAMQFLNAAKSYSIRWFQQQDHVAERDWQAVNNSGVNS